VRCENRDLQNRNNTTKQKGHSTIECPFLILSS
jgi:hypothetical protein